MTILEQIEGMREAAAELIQAAAEHDQAEELLAAEFEESKYTRDKSGKFSSSGGGGGAAKSKPSSEPGGKIDKATSSAMTTRSEGGGLAKRSAGGGGAGSSKAGSNVAKAAAAAGAVAVGVAAYQNKDSIKSGMDQLGDKAASAKISAVATAIDNVKGMETKVKGAMAGLSKKLGMDGAKDAGKSGGQQMMESVASMGASLKSGSEKAMQLTAARAATAVAAAQTAPIRDAFVASLKSAKNGEDVAKTIHSAAAAIDTAAHAKVGLDAGKKAVGEHAADIEKGTAAAVGLGVAVMASKKFMSKGKGKAGNMPAAQKALPGKGPQKALPGTSQKALPGKGPQKALPPGGKGGDLSPAQTTSIGRSAAMTKTPAGSAKKPGFNKAKAAAITAAVVGGVAALGAVTSKKEPK